MLFFGILAWLMESHDIPIGPMMLGIVLGGLLEQSFMTSMIKADGHIIGFFERPIAAGLSVITLCVCRSCFIDCYLTFQIKTQGDRNERFNSSA